MDLNAVYKKTQKGQEEMAQRTVLGMRERTLLVMVDGKTTAADLLARAQHMPDPQGLLAKLIDGGFIAPEASAIPPAAAAAPPQSALAPQDQLIMQNTMRYAERFLDQVLGPEADMLSEAIGRCKTMPELRARLEKTRDAVGGMGKKRRAEEFWIAVQALLEGKAPPSEAPPAAAPPSPAPIQSAPPAAPSAPAAAPPSQAAPPAPSIQEAIRFARRFIGDALGPNGDMLVEVIEKCKTVADLRITLEKTRDALQVGAGKRKADEFWEGVRMRLPTA